jgi:hypothetical protein
VNWLTKVFPWPAKRDRRAAIGAAAAEHKASRERAAESKIVRQQINRLAAANHYADAITEQILRGHE